MKYRVMVGVNIYPMEGDQLSINHTNSLYHSQTFDIGGDDVTRFSEVAPTIDAVYDAIQQAVETSREQ